jgi:hypothetical protein
MWAAVVVTAVVGVAVAARRAGLCHIERHGII